jgi:hypothetical protein
VLVEALERSAEPRRRRNLNATWNAMISSREEPLGGH